MLKDSTYPGQIPEIDDAPARQPSARAARSERNEQALCLAALDATLGATGQLDLDLRLASSVFGIPAYARLPRYRRQYVMGYAHGARDGLARRQGKPASIQPPPDPKVPARIQALQPNATWHRHLHGGGWVSSTAYAALTGYVGPSAAVYDQGRLLEMARLYGGAQLCEQAEMDGGAHAHGRSVIAGTTRLTGTARAFGNMLVVSGTYDKGTVSGPGVVV